MARNMLEPSIIGKYRVEGRLGQGGMGAVYLARDSRIGRLVALKVLRVDNVEMRNRFELEAQSAGRLKHTNIVTIYDYEEYDGNPCLVMEYVEGHTLAEMIQRGDPIPIGQRLDFVEQVCRGLAYAHAAGIVHRDIKPSNLMVDPHGVVKILDFGIARNAERGLTRSRRMVGTAGYMSPEQVRGDKVDQRCDVFAVGLVLYEFMTGRRAFPGENEYSVFDRILNGSPDPFDHPDARVIDGISPILDTALARLPENRYQTATALGADLATLRQQFDSGMDPYATVVAGQPAFKAPTPRPSADLGTPPPVPAAISPDHTPTREATRQLPREDTPRRVKTEPSAPPVAARGPSRTAIFAAASWIVLALVVGAQYVWPLVTGPAPAADAGERPAVTTPAVSDPVPVKPIDTTPSQSAAEQAAAPVAPAPSPAAAPPPVRNNTAKSNARPSVPVLTPETRKLLDQRLLDGQRLFDEAQYDAAIQAFQAALALDSADRRAKDGITKAQTAKAADEKFLRRIKPPS
ncbi:MAG: hypothetical protein A3G25_12390 [Betaproteobacteria bacterium RIFCSPLOWO2_12_FULL_63_13]|nr:MAG: hypothetical protein A3G25_12390 [Betaproteobacteria bacterium RIFCSPLOWO2_12_FULL_63_13]